MLSSSGGLLQRALRHIRTRCDGRCRVDVARRGIDREPMRTALHVDDVQNLSILQNSHSACIDVADIDRIVCRDRDSAPRWRIPDFEKLPILIKYGDALIVA